MVVGDNNKIRIITNIYKAPNSALGAVTKSVTITQYIYMYKINIIIYKTECTLIMYNYTINKYIYIAMAM